MGITHHDSMTLSGDLIVTGAATVTGAEIFNGSVTIGDTSADDLTINASVASSIAIKTNNSYDIGTSSKGLRDLYVKRIGYIADITMGAGATLVNVTDTLTVTEDNIAIAGNLSVTGNTTVGDAATDTMILKSRIASTSAAGAALNFNLTDGTTYAYNEAIELRPTVATAWATASHGTFQGMYLRMQADVAPDTPTAGGIRAAEIMGVSNLVSLGNLCGVFSEAYLKGATARTITRMDGLHAEISCDADTTATVTAGSIIRAKMLMAGVATMTGIHGIDITLGTMDGVARTIGSIIRASDDSENVGDITATYGLNLDGVFNISTADILFHDGATILNSDADTLTITEATTAFVGAVTITTTLSCNGNATLGNAATDVHQVNGRLDVSDVFVPALTYWRDDFMEKAAALASTIWSNAHWTGGGTAGTQAIVAGVGGWMELDTTATGSRTSTLTFATANFSTNNAPYMRWRMKTSNITNSRVEAGWWVDANDHLMFIFDTAVDANNIYLSSENNNGGVVTTDTTIDLAAGVWHTYEISINADETFAAYIDGVQVAGAHAGTIRALATFKPWFYVDNKAAAEQKLLDIDFVELQQALPTA